MPRNVFNPLDRPAGPCACGARQVRSDVVHRHCQLCRVVASEYPEWTPEQVAAEGRVRWLVSLFTGLRRRALETGEDTTTWPSDHAEATWSVHAGHEALWIRGAELDACRAALERAHPELGVLEESERGSLLGSLLGFRLGVREEAAA
jgi:hypothetical protein